MTISGLNENVPSRPDCGLTCIVENTLRKAGGELEAVGGLIRSVPVLSRAHDHIAVAVSAVQKAIDECGRIRGGAE